MAIEGKKINELTAIGTVSNETVLAAVYVSGTTVNSTANKISIEQISTKVQDDMSTTLAGKQDTLVSGTNIKTINNESLLGSGNIEIQGGSGDGADTDLSNLTNTGKIKAAHLAMPSGIYDELTIPSVDGSDITVPADGYLCLRGVAQGESPVLGLTNNTTGMNITSNATFMSALNFGVTLPVKKGDSVKIGFYHVNFNDATNPGFLRFIYANGSESEKGA